MREQTSDMTVPNSSHSDVEFTGEFFVPGQSSDRIEADHMERYIFSRRFANGKSVLDIACGLGYSAPIFIEAGCSEYVGVDISPKQVDVANRKYGSDKAKYLVGNICTFSPERKFDLIVCFETIEHVSEYQEALGNLHRMLSDTGVLLISTPNRPVTSPRARTIHDKPDNEFHTQEFTPFELRKALRSAGFKTIDSELYGQRQRFAGGSRVVRRLRRLAGLNPDETSSPAVEPVHFRTPRYFLLRATKQ